MANDATCVGPGRWGLCGRPIHVKSVGLCNGHYSQTRRGGVLRPLRADYAAGTPCDYEGCERAGRRNGFCEGHSQQLKAGRTLQPLRRYRARGDVLHRDDLGRKGCPRCGEYRLEGEFHSVKHTADGLSSICIRCDRNAKLIRKYKITLAEYEHLLDRQGGRCAICRAVECSTGKSFAVDHDHACCPGAKTCGKCVRGLLCWTCNSLLGFLSDDIEYAGKLIAYLKEKGVVNNDAEPQALRESKAVAPVLRAS